MAPIQPKDTNMAQKLPNTVSHASAPPSGNALGCQGLTSAGGVPFSASKEGGPLAARAVGALAASSTDVRSEERSVIADVCFSGVLVGEKDEMGGQQRRWRGGDSGCCDSIHRMVHGHHKRKFWKIMRLMLYLHRGQLFVMCVRVSGTSGASALQRLAGRSLGSIAEQSGKPQEARTNPRISHPRSPSASLQWSTSQFQCLALNGAD